MKRKRKKHSICSKLPSLTVILNEEDCFEVTHKAIEQVKKLDEPIVDVFRKLYLNRKILKVEYLIVKKSYLIIYKIFFCSTKYIKLLFKFYQNGDFKEISMGDFSVSIFGRKFIDSINELIIRSLTGVQLEKEFDFCLKKLLSKRFPCFLDYKNVSCIKEFDQRGTDFLLEIKPDEWMPLQLKKGKFSSENHSKLHPQIPCLVTHRGESDEVRELKLLNIIEKYIGGVLNIIVY